jgi:hypothetical protein
VIARARRPRGGAASLARALVVLAIGVGPRAATAAPGLRAEPTVQVVELAVNASGTGTIVLRNDAATSVVAAGITPEPGCDAAAVRASPLTGFTLAAGATRAIAIACTPAPASMRRCSYRVRSPASAVLAAFEAVCAYAGDPTLSASATLVELGAVAIGRAASATIALHNHATTAIDRLFVEATDLDDNFAIAAPCNPDARACDASIPVVPAGGATNLVVTCTPRSLGPLSALIHVTTSAGSRLAAPIVLTCTGSAAAGPVIATSPTAIDVGGVEVIAASARATVRVSNPGSGTVRLIQAQVVDGGTGAATDWAVAAQAPCATAIPPACNLAAGDAVDLELVFDPAAIGVRDAALLITYRDSADRSTSIPLHGVGQGATLELVGGPTTLDFGALPIDATGTLTFQVANTGSRDLPEVTRTLTPVAGFTVSPGPSFAVSAAAPTTITVSCTPTAPGALASVLRLEAPDVTSPPIDLAVRCTGDPNVTVTAAPPAVLLGEVRLMTQVTRRLAVGSVAAPIAIGTAALDPAILGMSISGAPAVTPANLDLVAAPRAEGSLAARILVSPASGPQLAIAVTGTGVAATYSVPAEASLGTFCVQQPTTPRMLPLTSTGTATIGLSAPRLALADSPFDLQLIAPVSYPAALAPLGSVAVAVTPKRRAAPGLVSDDLVWTTDVSGTPSSRTKVTASFVNNGGAIAPPALAFGSAPAHLDSRNARQVTLQNCDIAPLALDAPQLSPPFSIDSPGFPTVLRPGETATFSVGFHPTRLGAVARTLVITSPQLPGVQLTVALTGEGISTIVGGADAGPVERPDSGVFSCGGCASSDGSGALVLAVAALCTLAPRRRRR